MRKPTPLLILVISLWMGAPFTLIAQEARSLNEVMSAVSQETWVIFDIDDTLIAPAQMMGRTDWGHHLYRCLLNKGVPRDEAWERSSCLLYQAQAITQVCTIEPETAGVVSELQNRGVVVMALTARPYTFADQTQKQLESVGIDIQRTAPQAPSCCLMAGTPPPTYQEGVIYTYRTPKGLALKEFFHVMNLRPSKIIFVDDSPRHVESVELVMEEEGIECLCYRYGAADELRSHFDPDVADFQWEMLGRVLTDEQARLLLGKEDETDS